MDSHKSKSIIYFLIYDWRDIQIRGNWKPPFIILVQMWKFNGISLPWSIIYTLQTWTNHYLRKNTKPFKLEIEEHLLFKVQYSPHIQKRLPHSMYSAIICGMNYGKRCLFSTHLQLQISCIADNVLMLKITNKINFLSHSGKSLISLKKPD